MKNLITVFVFTTLFGCGRSCYTNAYNGFSQASTGQKVAGTTFILNYPTMKEASDRCEVYLKEGK